jgi:hypothetical protein
MEKHDFFGLHTGIADVIVDGERIGECIFDIEIIMNLKGRIEAQGIIDEVTEGDIDFTGKDIEFVLSGIISREETAFFTEFTCVISPASHPRFVVKDVEELFSHLSPVKEADEGADETEGEQLRVDDN